MSYLVRIWFKDRDGIPLEDPQEVRLKTDDVYVHNGQDGWTYLLRRRTGKPYEALVQYHAKMERWELITKEPAETGSSDS